ncbi:MULTISPECIES: FKBP-type peptidyl-prolyl cis-trans isomerase [Pseudomonas]|jgi:peptidylprolyl isomerase/FKBP-type peptidyl-prolyl cis-trans isomerase FklB|uniref:FKBP-type peptidyl-prolyl cis-trans isomerase n=1 Tax=Pseudomonas TaxID=286 RepID=UPI00059C2D21|nr:MULTISPECIES: FKBP-type peptidyl-prolyl cis-trans isomerase [Pseudomonas]AMT86206.1 peptidylprolyl isomerase [Pseudomonas koreensis]KQT61991.1 peptidylprolyl isomerase [Pseudomonas sp. Leaf434]MBB4057055.1 peptidylprolyl isomerase/FKBP-type peptidyl-prolyl cis-trans isomerase FklB [Pseudomonas koreensis]TSB53566.1 FKBP-type peptidyl-prolyl cis-trans isomerase [Pseudomonas sp. ef1]UST79597.1 FKBP-type peptidyl-prolyl cis-trans isomerase [Pseudomonas siliginis]
MSRYFILSLCVFFSTAYADEKTTANDAHDLAYSLGASLGERLRQEVPQLQIQALIEGLQQAYQGKPLALSEARIEQILADHESQNAEQASRQSSDAAMENEQRFLSTEKAKPGVKELADGILLTELVPGTGAKAGPDGKVQVLYVGKLPDGTVFDQNTQPQWFNLDSVIAGWRTALQNMPVGAKWRLVIPSDQAYGADGAGDLIAPFTPLVFEVELRGATS